MTSTYDAVIVGARVAGSGLAIRLARSGRSVLMIDRSAYGSDTLSSHGFGGMAMTQLAKLGVIDELIDTGAPKLGAFTIDFDGQTIAMPIQTNFGHDFTLAIRRTTLDPILVEHVRRAGAEVRHDVAARGLHYEGGRVVGVTIENKDGTTEDISARIVIGADGRHSQVAEWVGAEIYNRAASPCCAIYGYFEDFEPPESGWAIQLICGEGIDSIIAPSDGGLTNILVIFDPDRFQTEIRGGEEAFENAARSIPVLTDQMRSAKLVSKLRPSGLRELECFFRVPWGKGWALIGDAGYKEHPAAGRGIGNALRSAELVHQSIEQAWSEGKEADAYLDQYHALRDEHLRVSVRFSLMQASVNPMRKVSPAELGAVGAQLAALDAAAAT